MDNKYEERLGTASMLPLILKMALPGFAAQLINLLYSIVDRVFIGHIELIGTDALAGIGVTSSIIILISAFFTDSRRWRRTACLNSARQGRP